MVCRIVPITCTCTLALLLAAPVTSANAQNFYDGFDTVADRPSLNSWTTVFGPPSFLGRTQLRNWVTGVFGAKFPVTGGAAQLALDTFNPSGFSLYGTHAQTLQSFQATASKGYDLSVNLQLTTTQPGIVYGMYFFNCITASCSQHDELDIEVVTNLLQPGAPPKVQLNRYANEPLGPGHGAIADLPASFDALASHDWRIRWDVDRVNFSVDSTTLFTATDHIPQGPMQANIIAWAPAQEWPLAYSASLQPTSDAKLNQSFIARVNAVSVAAVTPVPEPGEWAMMLAGFITIALAAHRRSGQATGRAAAQIKPAAR